jgi:hypothetical protein
MARSSSFSLHHEPASGDDAAPAPAAATSRAKAATSASRDATTASEGTAGARTADRRVAPVADWQTISSLASGDDGWYSQAARHWNVDRPAPRE